MRIARVYFEQDMRCNFPGLEAVMRKEGVDPQTLPSGSFTLFMNAARTKFKMMVGNAYLVYFSNGNKRIPLEAIQHLPQFFDGTTLDFAKAIEKSVKEKMGLA